MSNEVSVELPLGEHLKAENIESFALKLKQEAQNWSEFFETHNEQLSKNSRDALLNRIKSFYQNLQIPENVDRDWLNNIKREFSKKFRTQGHIPPPLFTSKYGQYINQACESGEYEHAFLVFGFIAQNYDENAIRGGGFPDAKGFKLRSQALVDAISVHWNFSINKSRKNALEEIIHHKKNALQVLESQASDLKKNISNLDSSKEEIFEAISSRRDKIFSAIVKRFHKNISDFNQHFSDKLREYDSEFQNKVKKYESIFLEFEKNISDKNDHVERLIDDLTVQLRYKTSIKLWEERKELHEEHAKIALKRFYISIFIFLAFVFAILGFALFGPAELILQSYTCGEDNSQLCPGIAPKAYFVISSLVLITSIGIWYLRFQMKIHLSERHLSLDAEEKRAFAETFMALKHDENLSSDHEQIVLGALFRATQDGIIREDPAIDASLSGQISKLLGGRG